MIYADAVEENGTWHAYVVVDGFETYTGEAAHSNPQDAIDEAQEWVLANT